MDEGNAVGRNIAALVKIRNTTQSAIASVCGVTAATVSNWISGRHDARSKYLRKIADYYDLTIDELTSDENGLDARMRGRIEGAREPKPPRRAYAPLYGRVHAGDPEEPEVVDDRVPIPYEVWEHHRRAYFVEVEGTCMDRVYPEGCLVLVDPDVPPGNGSIAVVSIDGEHVMRRLLKGADSLILAPESSDPAWRDIVVTGEADVRTRGTVVWWQAEGEME